jgi:hypothetical protein
MSATIRHFVGLPNKNGVFVLHPSPPTLFKGVRGELTGANAVTWNNTPHRSRTSERVGRRHLFSEGAMEDGENSDPGFLAEVKGGAKIMVAACSVM